MFEGSSSYGEAHVSVACVKARERFDSSKGRGQGEEMRTAVAS